jgi:chromosome segregation ATPase
MSQIVNELATIEVSNEVLQQMDLGGIYRSFTQNYKKLDDLKNFRTDYEKKNRIMRWWHNDKLRDAQLDSAEVQAEFSKTIGQLMMISIIQSKRLTEQQTQLNEQQDKLKTQANGIEAQASELQMQHHALAEQSQKLETLVNDYFALKGLTEDGAQKLIEIAAEIKGTKQSMLDEFSTHTQTFKALCGDVSQNMERLSATVDEKLTAAAEQTRSNIGTVQEEINARLLSSESMQHEAYRALNTSVASIEQRHNENHASLTLRSDALDLNLTATNDEVASLSLRSLALSAEVSAANAELTARIKHQQDTFISSQQDTLRKFKRLQYTAIGLASAGLGSLIGLVYVALR